MARTAAGVSAEYLAKCGIEAPKKRSKYGAVRTEYDGRVYDSALEATAAAHLDLLMRDGLVLEWEPQPTFDLSAGITYRADFWVRYATGAPRVIDMKGVQTDVFKLKRRLYEHLYGPLDVVKTVAGLPSTGRPDSTKAQ